MRPGCELLDAILTENISAKTRQLSCIHQERSNEHQNKKGVCSLAVNTATVWYNSKEVVVTSVSVNVLPHLCSEVIQTFPLPVSSCHFWFTGVRTHCCLVGNNAILYSCLGK